MKKILLLPALLLFVLSSCHKDASLPANTVVADVDGVTETFDISVSAGYQLTGPYSIYISSFKKTGATSADGMLIGIGNAGAPITSGTYKYKGNVEGIAGGTVVFQSNPSDFDYTPDDTNRDATIVTITAISNTNIKGTFSGKLTGTNDRTRTITNGRFNVNFK